MAVVAIAFTAGCASPAAGQPTAVKPAHHRTTARASRSHHAETQLVAKHGQRLPRFSATVSGPLARKDVPYSWHRGCPVPPGQLRAIRMRFVGFDHRAHIGKLIVNASVVRKVIRVFAILYRHRFPIRSMKPVDAYHGSDPRSMAADNTSGFNCRRAVASGPPTWSMHAYGLAIDVNTVQNPYVESPTNVQPKAGRAYLNRSDHRPGMAYPGGILLKAFYSIGWGWGGNFAGTPDYQHFSSTGQ